MMREDVNFKIHELSYERKLSAQDTSRRIDVFLNSKHGKTLDEGTRAKLQVVRRVVHNYSGPLSALECFKVSKVKFSFPLGCSELFGTTSETKMNSLLQGVILGVFLRSLQGLLLSYSDYTIPKLQKISGHRTHIYVPITVDALIFSPLPDQIVSGKVNFFGPDCIQLLFFESFNVTIPNLDNSSPSSSYRDLNVGDELLVKINSVSESLDPMMIYGNVYEESESSGVNKVFNEKEEEEEEKGDEKTKKLEKEKKIKKKQIGKRKTKEIEGVVQIDDKKIKRRKKRVRDWSQKDEGKKKIKKRK